MVPRLIIAYMQARVGSRRAVRTLHRQHRIISEFQAAFCIPIDKWYYRAKGLSPLPTTEQLIEEGKVYAVTPVNGTNSGAARATGRISGSCAMYTGSGKFAF